MGSLPNLSPERRAEIAKRYAAGWRIKTIAHTLGVGQTTVSTVAKQYGITKKSRLPLIRRGGPSWAQGLMGFGS